MSIAGYRNRFVHTFSSSGNTSSDIALTTELTYWYGRDSIMSGARRKSHWLQPVTQFPVHNVTEVKSVNGF